MATIQKLSVKDEVVDGEVKYRIIGEDGSVLYDNCTIEMITSILTQGTNLNKLLFDKIDSNFDVVQSLIEASKVRFVTGSFLSVYKHEKQHYNVGFRPDLVILYQSFNNYQDISGSPDNSPIILTTQFSGDTSNDNNITDTGFAIETRTADVWAAYIAIKFIKG